MNAKCPEPKALNEYTARPLLRTEYGVRDDKTGVVLSDVYYSREQAEHDAAYVGKTLVTRLVTDWETF